MLMSRVWIAILFAMLVVVPVQSRLAESRACLAFASLTSLPGTDEGSCCGTPSAPDRPADEAPRDESRPCDDCPRPCCSVLKMTVPATMPQREHPRMTASRDPVALAAGAVRAAHLDRLDRPPQRAAAA